MRVTGKPFCCAGEQIWSLMSWKSENLSLSLSPLIWDRLRRDSGLETASQSSRPPRLQAMRRVCGLESLRIFLGFRNQRLRSQIQTSPMELPGPDSEDLKTSWKTPKQVRPYERPSTKQWHGAPSPRGPDSPAEQTWTPVSMLTNWTQTPLTLFSRWPQAISTDLAPISSVFPQIVTFLSPSASWPLGLQLYPHG